MHVTPQTPRGPAHLGTSHRRFVYAIFAALFVTAALWLAFHYFIVVQGEFGPEHHPLEAWWLKLHGAAAMAALLLFGSLLPEHVRLGWLRRRNLGSAIPLALLAVFLIVTGYGLYYAGDEDLRSWFSLAHWIAGWCCGVVLAAHAFWRRKKRRAPRTGPARTTPDHASAIPARE
jgi:hypothetical protein